MRRLVDISVDLRAGIASDPPGNTPEIEYIDHGKSVGDILAFFPGARPTDLPDGEGWAIERVTASTHTGTHMDAPYHYASTMDGGKRAITIDEIPLEWCLSDGVKLDFREFPDGYVVTPDDIDRALRDIDYRIKPLDIVVVNTSAGLRYGEDDFVSKGCGFGREATLHLLRQGVRVVGTDGWSWDAPFVYTAQRFQAEGDPSIIWEGHKAGREIGYCQLEKLHNLEALPAVGFQISCFPVKISKASAGWTRAVAVFEED